MKKALEPDVWDVLFAVERERVAQDDRWGQQDHPDFPADTDGIWAPGDSRGKYYYHVPSADEARADCEDHFKNGWPNWGSILVEEVCEALDAEGENLRTELIQVAAVAAAWVQAIDRRAGPQPQSEAASAGRQRTTPR